MVANSDVITQVESFIADLHNGNIQLASKAIKLSVYKAEKGKKITLGTLPDFLGQAIADYQQNKNDPSLRLLCAKDCLFFIEMAYTHGVIKSIGLINKIKRLEQENAQLKEEVAKLQKENQKLHNEIKKWGKVGHISDVEEGEAS